jgi:hypothetical protein
MFYRLFFAFLSRNEIISVRFVAAGYFNCAELAPQPTLTARLLGGVIPGMNRKPLQKCTFGLPVLRFLCASAAMSSSRSFYLPYVSQCDEYAQTFRCRCSASARTLCSTPNS